MKVYNLVEHVIVSRRFKGHDRRGDFCFWKHIADSEVVMGCFSTREAAKKKAESFSYRFTDDGWSNWSWLKQTNIDGLEDLMMSREMWIKEEEVEE